LIAASPIPQLTNPTLLKEHHHEKTALHIVCLRWLGVTMAQTTLDPAKYVNIQISSGDTLSNGTHDPAKTVYLAQSGQIYAFDGTLFANFPLVIQGPSCLDLHSTTPPIFYRHRGNWHCY
jgi:hypothetical protein